MLKRQQWPLLVILILIAAIAGMFAWKKIAVDRTRAEVTSKAGQVIAAHNEAFLHLVTVPLVWAVRSEMIRGNYDQINQYLINFVREPNVDEVALAKPDGVILLATNKRLEGTPLADSFPATVLQAEKTVVTSLKNRGLLAASPVMGISGKLGVLLGLQTSRIYSGITKGAGMNPVDLSKELRTGQGRFLENRRRIVVSTVTAMLSIGLISLYQLGVFKHLPELPIKGFDADKVDASGEAYRHLQMGDAFIGMASYVVTAGLAAMGSKERARTDPWIPLALAVKAGTDAVQAARLTYDQFARHRAACMWCLLAAGATFTTMVLAVPEARRASLMIRQSRRTPFGRSRDK